ncbi:MAG: hypothetical protein ACLTEH_01120 [Clostridia bacterium]
MQRVYDVALSKVTYELTGKEAYYLKEPGKELWIDSSSLLPLQYYTYDEGTPAMSYFTFKLDSVTKEDIQIPDFSDYTIAS